MKTKNIMNSIKQWEEGGGEGEELIPSSLPAGSQSILCKFKICSFKTDSNLLIFSIIPQRESVRKYFLCWRNICLNGAIPSISLKFLFLLSNRNKIKLNTFLSKSSLCGMLTPLYALPGYRDFSGDICMFWFLGIMFYED